MAATYDPTLPADLDWVRFLVGDRRVDPVTAAALSDEEILAVLGAEANKYLAAARCGEAIIAKSRGAVSKSVGDLSISYGDSPESAYRAHLKKLREKGAELLLKRDGGSAVLRTL